MSKRDRLTETDTEFYKGRYGNKYGQRQKHREREDRIIRSETDTQTHRNSARKRGLASERETHTHTYTWTHTHNDRGKIYIQRDTYTQGEGKR